MAKKSPARSRSRPKSTSPPKERRTPARGRRSRTSAKDEEEEQAEQEEKEENKEEEEEDKEEEEEDKEAEEDKEEDVVAATSATDEEQVGTGEEPADESEPTVDVEPVDKEMVADTDRPDTVPADDLQTQPTPASHADNSVCHMEDEPHVDRKRKFDEIEDESDDVEEEGGVAKMLKVCEDSDVKTSASVESVETPLDGETTSSVEAAAEPDVTAESKLSLPLSTETNIEDDYIVITPDDVPPVDSDEVMNTAAKMVPSLSSAVSDSCSNEILDAEDIPNPLLCREFIANPAILSGPADSSRRFTLGSYNILADYHAQKDYGRGIASWLTPEQLSLSSRHQRLVEELIYLDQDIICLQEVGGDYMHDMLQPTLER